MTTLTAYLLESKADWPDPATEPDPAEGQELDAEPQEWAGDLYDAGDETDPADAFAVFQGGAGLEGWLDRADDGTLTGWVRDPAGGVYRYSDVDAWAIDVRDSGMSRTDPGLGGEEPVDGEDPEADPDAEADPAGEDPDPFAAADDEDLDAEPDDELEVDDDAAAEVGADTDEEDPNTDDLADDMDPDEDDDEDDFTSKFKRKGVEGKSYELVFEPWTGGR